MILTIAMVPMMMMRMVLGSLYEKGIEIGSCYCAYALRTPVPVIPVAAMITGCGSGVGKSRTRRSAMDKKKRAISCKIFTSHHGYLTMLMMIVTPAAVAAATQRAERGLERAGMSG